MAVWNSRLGGLLLGCLLLGGCGGATPPANPPVSNATPAPQKTPEVKKPAPKPAPVKPAPKPQPPKKEEPAPLPLRRTLQPRPALASETPVKPLGPVTGIPEQDGCQWSETRRGEAVLQRNFFHYDSQWRLKHRLSEDPATGYYILVNFLYDEAGRLIEHASKHGGDETFRYLYKYDDKGRLIQEQWNEWRVFQPGTSYALRKEEEFYRNVTTYAEASASYDVQQMFGNYPGMTRSYITDDKGRVTRHEHSFIESGGDPETGMPVQRRVVTEIAQYAYDDGGALTGIRRTRPRTGADGAVTGEDPLGDIAYTREGGRLVKETGNSTADGAYAIEHRYDEQGRLIESVRTDGRGATITTYAYAPRTEK